MDNPSLRTRSAPRLSIVVATFQAAATLERCLDSIVGQTFRDWELLIPDGASSDGTTEIIRRYEPHVAWWISAADSGIYDAWNRALAHARGEYVCFLGADDAFTDKDALARVFAAIGDKEFDLVSSYGRVVTSTKGKEHRAGGAMDFARLGRRMPVCHPGLLHRRALFDNYGSFDASYQITGDLDFLLRIPTTARTLHVRSTTVTIDGTGVSRSNLLGRLREQRRALASCPRYGPVRAYLAWLDKLWRLPVARLLGLPY